MPTNNEMQELAVRALGEGATVVAKRAVKEDENGRLSFAHAYERSAMAEIIVWAHGKDSAKRALAAALEALAEVR